MDKTRVGELIKLYRRKRPGIGLIIFHVPDILQEMENPEALCALYKSREAGHTWQDRNRACHEFTEEAGLSIGLAEAFLRYNSFHSYQAEKPKIPNGVKTDFVYVRWFKRPSEYEKVQTIRECAWYPADWLKKVY